MQGHTPAPGESEAELYGHIVQLATSLDLNVPAKHSIVREKNIGEKV